jgi:hypothetical protein
MKVDFSCKDFVRTYQVNMYTRIFCLEFFEILKYVKNAFENKGSIYT